ncbi:family 16 glycoside hydrolase [Actinokineospora sp. HUAS TT18]|uniref:family 16 glycoside hydrolase n=1 Tax=Actinokineospora sp. HUAS TT18 TaxID=3447451 RepID=UPI003F523905
MRAARRRWLGAVGALLGVATSFFVTSATANAAIPEQQPGVTLRTYDVGVELSTLCALKPGQTPNVDKLMSTVNWSTTTDFGLGDKFMTEVIGYLVIPTTGAYTFRLTSDDGSRMSIDGGTVINHDGTHGATAKEASVSLSAGSHALRIEHFDGLGGQVLKLEWKTPGATGFVVVPNSALSTDKNVTRVTAPGVKECTGGTDAPGDGLPLTSVHPNYTLTNLRPAGFQPQVTGMDWLPDGRLAITTWGGAYGDPQSNNGDVHLLGNVTGATSPTQVTTKKVASGLNEPMGVKYVDGKLYVSVKEGLVELNDTNGDEVTDSKRTVVSWPWGGTYHEHGFGMLYKDGYFYLSLSVQITQGGTTTNPQIAANRGTSIKVNKATGAIEYVAGGLRTPNGIAWGPENGVFVTDNQGGYLPANKLVHIKPGRFFNSYLNPDGQFDDKPVTQPVLWIPQNEIGNSPSMPVQVTQGTFAGQMMWGDVTYGGIQRGFLEKVNGEYQGAVFRLTQGLEAGVNRVSIGPDGAIYAGGIGGGGNWGQAGKLTYGLQKLTPNGGSAFDILAMRAVAGGFELEYTQPLSTQTVADLATKYRASQWRYVPTPSYGGPKVDNESLTVTSASVSSDRKKVTLKLAGLKPGRVVYVRSPRPFASEAGQSLWSTEAWYTLNSTPAGGTAPPVYDAESAQLAGGVKVMRDHTGYTGDGFVAGYAAAGDSTKFGVNVASAGAHNVAVRYSNGGNPTVGTKTLGLYVNGAKLKQLRLVDTAASWDTWATHVESVPLSAGANTIEFRMDSGDTGHVNLDSLTVSKAQRITLFDGVDLNAWESAAGGAATWPVAGGSMESLGGDIRTKMKFGDFKMHAEWYEPVYAPEVTGQQRGNSGVKLQERYEIQVLDSYGDTTLANNEAGAIYTKRAPDRNMATAPETWQSYDITFRAARYDAAGTKIDNARVSVTWNGQVVHNDVAIDSQTGASAPEGPSLGSILLQDHGDAGPNPRFRNVWVEPIAAPGPGPIVGVGGKCVDVKDADGTTAQLGTCANVADQIWTRSGETVQTLGKCLDVAGGATADGTSVRLWTCNGTAAQNWAPRADGSLVNPISGKCLDAFGGSSAVGTRLIIWPCTGGSNQRWTSSAWAGLP